MQGHVNPGICPRGWQRILYLNQAMKRFLCLTKPLPQGTLPPSLSPLRGQGDSGRVRRDPSFGGARAAVPSPTAVPGSGDTGPDTDGKAGMVGSSPPGWARRCRILW